MKKYILLLCFLGMVKMGYGEIILDSDDTSPRLDETFKLTATFIDSDKDNYKIEGLDNFQILNRGSQSSYTSIYGKVTVKKSETFLLKPLSLGEKKLKVIGKDENSKELVIDVKKSEVRTAKNSKFYLEENKLKKDYYFGEKIPFRENLVSKVSLSGLQWVKGPDFKDFSVKDVTDADNNGNFIQKLIRIEGKQALEVQVYSGILQANSSGEKEIVGGQLAVTESNDMNSFFNQSAPIYLGPKIEKINILPLPENAPKNFQNIVGNIKINSSWSGDSVNYGEAITLTVNLSGDGNLALLNNLIDGQLKEFTVYETVKNYKEGIDNNGKYYNNKSIEVAFVPKNIGKLKIPEIKIPYFNTTSKKYEFEIIPEKTIVVKGEISKSDKQGLINNNTEHKYQEPLKIKEVKIEKIPIKQVENRNIYKLSTFILGILNILQLVLFIIFIKKNKR
ncbi:Oxygen tolerance [Cetobacterium ceti]|uniref:Oxygen tolerance n=1 Tax=Cetobacterium ceti TaxID=180163 RepID=A0A1T4MXB2_9FUSO|nr:BatD family protein [Cetobacterium ceti]SJZ71699.1 Oxygen tolerance [Cetobacterium ceti]